MGYRFEVEEAVREGIRRCAAEQLDLAVSALSRDIGDDPVRAVHAARKAVKKERSLLRLARGSMPGYQRSRENVALRDAARDLSRARDGEVMVQTLDALAERYAGQLAERIFDVIRERLVAQRDRERAELAGSALVAETVEALTEVRARVDDWSLTSGGWRAIESGLRRSYADGREQLSRVRPGRSTDEWHTWRKRVKDLCYQERLLAPVAGPAVKGQVKDAHRLGDLLGDDHDLAMLRHALRSGLTDAPVDLDAVIELIDHRRQELQIQALHIGARVYAESSRRFVTRMRRSWKAGRAQARAARGEHPSELAHVGRNRHSGSAPG